ncbi:MAG: adenylyltransferase/cytidyltransferase family protein [Bacteroidales bacterium]|nr:adenylyltransferase/cytidyltransferase family protein [Bacteroidales bacterium]
MKIVFVTGCFDMLHSGHIAFLNEAATYGNVHVGLGSDHTINELKGRETINSEDERKYMLEAVKSVHTVTINSGSGLMDFEDDLDMIRPDIFIVNEDGHSEAKSLLCKKLGIEYIVLSRIPHANLPPRSTTSIRSINPIPYRIDFAGTWIDQPYVSKFGPGWAVTASIEPTIEFNERSGMATSTRKKAIELWNHHLPPEKPEKLAKLLFRYDNEPGSSEISGSQDAIGITLPGINRFFYEKGSYWPSKFESIHDETVIRWLEEHIRIMTLWPRPNEYDVLGNTDINSEKVRQLTNASDEAWKALQKMDLDEFSRQFLRSFEAQVAMFPSMLNQQIEDVIEGIREKALAWKLSGAGGGGYLVMVTRKHIPNSFRIKIRRRNSDF